MPRPRTGTVVKTSAGLWQPIVTLADGSRRRLEPFPHGTTKEQARQWTARLSTMARDEHPPLPKRHSSPSSSRTSRTRSVSAPETPIQPTNLPDTALAKNQAWLERWSQTRQHLSSQRDSIAHWRHHIEPFLGQVDIAEWDGGLLRDLVQHLDQQVHQGKISAGTAKNIWSTVSAICRDACRGRVTELIIRSDNPRINVAPPLKAPRREKQFLFPDEFKQLIETETVPHSLRLAIAFAVFTGCRAGEMAALRSDDIDIEHKLVHVHRSLDWKTGKVGSTKGTAARHVPLHPHAMVLLLELMRGPGQLLFPDMPAPRELSNQLRDALHAAGITRARLFENSLTTKRITWHDLRSTFITWLALDGLEPLKIQQRAGHSQFSTTAGYVRLAEHLGEGFGEVFPSVDRLGSLRLLRPRAAKSATVEPPAEQRAKASKRRDVSSGGLFPNIPELPKTPTGRTKPSSRPLTRGQRARRRRKARATPGFGTSDKPSDTPK